LLIHKVLRKFRATDSSHKIVSMFVVFQQSMHATLRHISTGILEVGWTPEADYSARYTFRCWMSCDSSHGARTNTPLKPDLTKSRTWDLSSTEDRLDSFMPITSNRQVLKCEPTAYV
jgi:hypothetical protein